ncbi:MAG TPA: hypothetical protein PLE77_13040 [Kiritimatiellia bacterium]|nr:hypothetical protein [Kiritimatiellia bacterium]
MSGPPPLPVAFAADENSGQTGLLAREWAVYWRGSLIWSFLLGATLALGVPKDQWAAAGIVLFTAFFMYPFFLLTRWVFRRGAGLFILYNVLIGATPLFTLAVGYIFLGLARLVAADKQFWHKLVAALVVYAISVTYVMVVPQLAAESTAVEESVDTNEYVEEGAALPVTTVETGAMPDAVSEPLPTESEPVAPVASTPSPALAPFETEVLPSAAEPTPVVSPAAKPPPAKVATPEVATAPAPSPAAVPVPVAPQPVKKPKRELSSSERERMEKDIATARTMLRTTGVIKRGGEYRALVNDQVLGKGDMIPVEVKGKTYTFVIAEIDAKNVSFEPVIDQ